jgi:hypothetical protein
MTDANHLKLNLPASSYIFPILGGICMSLNPFHTAFQSWITHPLISSLFIGFGILVGVVFGITLSSTQLVGIHFSENRLQLIPRTYITHLPGWLTGLGSWEIHPGEGIFVPFDGLTLEWVGRTLLLHQAGNSIRLGRGKSADQIISFLSNHGFSNPVGK